LRAYAVKRAMGRARSLVAPTGGRARSRGPAACWIWKYMRIKANRKAASEGGEGGDAALTLAVNRRNLRC
jgi:hypothetical protein